nr:MAG TPA: Maltodextrin-binding protein,Interferon regulatory factor 3 E6 protein, E6AP, LxxLL [Caudoviricetes sp.]
MSFKQTLVGFILTFTSLILTCCFCNHLLSTNNTILFIASLGVC